MWAPFLFSIDFKVHSTQLCEYVALHLGTFSDCDLTYLFSCWLLFVVLIMYDGLYVLHDEAFLVWLQYTLQTPILNMLPCMYVHVIWLFDRSVLLAIVDCSVDHVWWTICVVWWCVCCNVDPVWRTSMHLGGFIVVDMLTIYEGLSHMYDDWWL